MPRKPRYYLPGVPSHVIQRGNNRQPCFFDDDDYRYFLGCLKEAAGKYRCAVHAYVLMTNHVHLLLSPETRTGISQVMQSVGRRYVRYVNQRYRRTGTLWEGRHKASLIDSETYLLTCYRYIELNPVRAGMVTRPGEYRWSSYAAHAYGRPDPLLEDHPEFLALGREPEERRHAYRELFRHHLKDEVIQALRKATNLGVPAGNDRFRRAVERQLGQPISYRTRGRPRKKDIAQ